jgi:hypothetical protein
MATDVTGCIRAKIAAGSLPIPSDPPDQMWVGNGNGRACDACDQPITDTEFEYETDLPTGQTLRFHRECLQAWHQERASRMTG